MAEKGHAVQDYLFALGTSFGLSRVFHEMGEFFRIKIKIAKVKCDW